MDIRLKIIAINFPLFMLTSKIRAYLTQILLVTSTTAVAQCYAWEFTSYICICNDIYFSVSSHISMVLDRQLMPAVESDLAFIFHLLVRSNPIKKAMEGDGRQTSSVSNKMLPDRLHVSCFAKIHTLT